MIVEVGQTELSDIVKDGVHLLDIYGTHCGPCKILAKTLEQVAAKFPDFSILKLNADENPEFIEDHLVRGVPTLFLYVDGVFEKRLTGALGERALLDWIGEYLYD